jgi:soluble lytic murein transglycosylase
MSPARSATRPRRRPARGQSRRRRWGWIAVAALLGVGLAIGISRIDVQKAIRELTLPLQHDDIIRQQAAEKNLDPAMIAAVIYAESRFRDQESHAGALGLMQITPETAQVIEHLSGGTSFVTSDLSDPEINIRYGSYYLRYLLDRYDGNEVAALAAYNAGTGNVDRWGASGLAARRHPVSRDARLRRGGARQTPGVSRPVRPGSGASQPMKPHRGGWGGRPR